MIKIYDMNNCDKKEFYSITGQYFAEKKYRKESPYLNNEDGRIWFLKFDKDVLIGFGSVQIFKNKIELTGDYIIKEFRQKGYNKEIIQVRLDYVKNINKAIEYATPHKFIKDMMIREFGFQEYKSTFNYSFLRRNNNGQ